MCSKHIFAIKQKAKKPKKAEDGTVVEPAAEEEPELKDAERLHRVLYKEVRLAALVAGGTGRNDGTRTRTSHARLSGEGGGELFSLRVSTLCMCNSRGGLLVGCSWPSFGRTPSI